MVDYELFKESLTIEDITKLLKELGSQTPKKFGEAYVFQTVCHNTSNGKYKLYYYQSSHKFHCYTDCSESFSVYDLVIKNRALHGLQLSPYQALEYISLILGKQIKQKNNKYESNDIIDDWDWIENYNITKSNKIEFPKINKSILKYFDDYYHESWIKEGITIETMQKFDIKFYSYQNKIVIPHFDYNGELIGIRGRALNQEEIDLGKKYMPIYINDNCFKTKDNEIRGFNHNTGLNFYGLHKTKEAIKKFRKIAVFEAEKSVLKCEEFYNDSNFSVSMGGSSKFSRRQIELLLNLDIEEVILCYDKEYIKDETEESEDYAKKICRTVKDILPYFRVYVLWDTDNLLELKSAPCDHGKETLEKLMKNKIEIDMDMINDMIGVK